MEISNPILAAFGIQELWPILLIVVVLFGAKKIPELARGLGSGMKEFKKAVREVNDDDETVAPKPSTPNNGGS